MLSDAELRERASQLTLAEMLRRHAERTPLAPALGFEGRQLAYGALNRRADQLAGALADRGLGRGDRVAVLLYNGLELVETLFAAHKLGAVAVPVNFRLSDDEVAYILGHSGSRGVVCDPALAGLASGGSIEWTLITGEASGERDSYEAARAEQDAGDRGVPLDDDAPAFVMYTSGTTGRPKGAVLTHKNILVNTWSWMFEVGVGRDDVYTAGFPLFHIGGLVGLYPFLFAGARTVLQGSGGFDAASTAELIERSGATICAFVPTQWQLIVDLPDATSRLDRVRRAIWGGAPASRPLLERMVDVLPPNSVVSTFGQTETTANATFLGPDDALRKLGSVGRPAVTIEHRIVDLAGEDVPQGEVGEIVYRGPTVMREYLDDPEATAEEFRGGWFHSGDLVRADEDGYIHVVDRKKDMIISGGENVYPAEVERVLVEHPAVREVAVIGMPHAKWGETPAAFVVRAPETTTSAQELIDHCTGRLARYKRPSAIRFVDELPRNAAGKVLKRALRERTEPATATDAPPASGEEQR